MELVPLLALVAGGAVVIYLMWKAGRVGVGSPLLTAFDQAADAGNHLQVITLEPQALAQPPAQDPEVRAAILYNAGRSHLQLGRVTDARTRLDETMVLATDRTMWLRAANLGAICAQRLGDLERARTLHLAIIEAYEAGVRDEEPFMTWSGAHLQLADLARLTGNRVEYAERLERARQVLERSGDEHALTVYLGGAAEIALFDGDLDLARRSLTELPGDPADRRWEANWMRAFLLLYRAEVRARDGATAEAQHDLGLARAFAAEAEGSSMEGTVAHREGRIAAALGDHTRARDALTHGRDWYDGQEQYNAAAEVATDLAELAVAAGFEDAGALVADAIGRNEYLGYAAVVERLRRQPQA